MRAAEFVSTLPSGMEAWRRGRVLFVVPTIPDDARPELKDALSLRRRALLAGECPCGARLVLSAAGFLMAHADDCPAGDESIKRLLGGES